MSFLYGAGGGGGGVAAAVGRFILLCTQSFYAAEK